MSPNMQFGEGADAELNEDLQVAFAAHVSRKNGEQTFNRMRACLKRGYWCLPASMGYKKPKNAKGEKVMYRDEPLASIIAEGLNGFANGRFQTQAELKRFFEQYPEFPRDKYGAVRNQRVKEILTRMTYTGYVENKAMDVGLIKGSHPPLISYMP